MRSHSLFFLLSFILSSSVATIHADKVCPSHGNDGLQQRDICNDQCLLDDDKCEPYSKCCFLITPPCGNRCIVPKDNAPKPGECPSPESNQMNLLWSTCGIRLCDVDNDCTGDMKCCSNACKTRLCLTPEQSWWKRLSSHAIE